MSKRMQHGSLRRRKTGGAYRWLATWWADGHRRAKTLGKCASMTRPEAEAELRKLVQPLNEASGAAEYSLQGYARTVVFPWYRRSWKPSTAMTTEDRQDHHILQELGNRPLSSFDRTILQDFLDEKARTGKEVKIGKTGKKAKTALSQATLSHLRWDLRQLFGMAVNDGLLSRNPAELLHVPTGTRQEKRVLSLDELRTILAALPLRDKLIISLAGISGMRPGEILALCWGDLRDDGVHIQRGIYRNVIQSPKTRQSVRTAAISTSIREDFEAWRALSRNTNPEDWVFPNENGNKPIAHGNYWRRNLKPTLDALKLTGVTFQALRRTAVTLMNANGADASIVAAQCGHSVDVSTNVYNRVGISRQADAINKLANVLAVQPEQRVS